MKKHGNNRCDGSVPESNRTCRESIWNKIEEVWPLSITGQRVSFAYVRRTFESFLVEQNSISCSFSHFGVVVNDITASLDILRSMSVISLENVTRTLVNAYNVYVARCMINETELEFIEPAGNSFFKEYLLSYGEGLQHVGFFVQNIHEALEILKSNNVKMMDKEPCCGSHGKISFCKTEESLPILTELCQKHA